MFAAIDGALKWREERLAARAAAEHSVAAAARQLQRAPSRPPLAAPLGNNPAGGNPAAPAARDGKPPAAPPEEGGAGGGTPGVDTPSARELRDALVAEVLGLAENVQEVCAMIRADTAALAAGDAGGGVSAPASPRRQAHEVR